MATKSKIYLIIITALVFNSLYAWAGSNEVIAGRIDLLELPFQRIAVMPFLIGKRLWRGAFDGAQKALTEDVVGGLKAIKMGIHWLSVDELARYAVKQVFRKFPLPEY
jgi:hypothetical protein